MAYPGGANFAEITVMVPQAYGTWMFAARVEDGAENQQAALGTPSKLVEVTQFVSGEEPLTPELAYASYDSGTDVVTFNVT